MSKEIRAVVPRREVIWPICMPMAVAGGTHD
jgi:hypothetical protein